MRWLTFDLPGPLAVLILVAGTYRLTRFAGWDDWPPIARLRARVVGEDWTLAPGYRNAADALTATFEGYLGGTVDEAARSLPGKTPDSEVEGVEPGYRRPTLAHLVHCPWCLGLWLSFAVYGCWLAAPDLTVYVLAPFALSTAIGLIARNLDP